MVLLFDTLIKSQVSGFRVDVFQVLIGPFFFIFSVRAFLETVSHVVVMAHELVDWISDQIQPQNPRVIHVQYVKKLVQ